MNNIFEKLKVDFQYITGYIYKGLIASLGAGFASRLAEFQSKLSFIEKQAFISTADKEYLYLKAGRMLPPLPPETAEGFVVFYGENGAVVPQGIELKDDNGTFKTLTEAEISTTTLNGTVSVADGIAVMVYISHEITNCSGEVNEVPKDITVVDVDTLQFEAGNLVNGQAVTVTTRHTAIVPIIADESGIASNRELNDILKTKVTVENVDKEVGIILVAGGKDEEGVEEYRTRVEDYMTNPQSPFNDNNIKYVNLNSIKTLKYVWVESPIEGEVKVVSLNQNFGLTAEEQESIMTATKSIAPAQMDKTAITVALPTVADIQVVIQDLSPASDGLKSAVEKNIKYIYEVDMYEKGISSSLLEATIYKTTNGAEQVESFTLVSGQTAPTDDTFWKYTGTTFQ